MGATDLSDLWLKGDDGLGPSDMDGAPPRPAKGYILVPVDWLARVWPLLRSAQQVLVLQLIYRRCLIARSRTVPLPNGDLAAFGISRYGKYRTLAALGEAGLVSLETRNGRAVQVTLNDFP